jgi:hypothetical protein
VIDGRGCVVGRRRGRGPLSCPRAHVPHVAFSTTAATITVAATVTFTVVVVLCVQEYVGEWLDDLQHGKGTCKYADGQVRHTSTPALYTHTAPGVALGVHTTTSRSEKHI